MFSVIIAVYNGAQTIGRAVDSVLSQSHRPDEVIVVDDGSTDATRDELHRFGSRIRVHRQPNRGVSVARNAGVNLATSDWLAFLDADDWYYPDRLRWHAEWIAADPGLDFLTGDFDYLDADGGFLRHSMESTPAGQRLLERAARGRAVMEPEDLALFIEQHFGDTHTLSLPRRAFLALGGYPAGVAVCEDVSFLIRLTARSRRIGVVCEPMAAYVIHGASATRRDPLRSQRETLAALLAVGGQLDEPRGEVRAGLAGAIRKARMDLAYALLRRGRRAAALAAVAPLLRQPRWSALRDVLSVARGFKPAVTE